jgi:hypothetical protein
MSHPRSVIASFETKFLEVRRESEMAIAQLDAERIRSSIDGEVNSVAIIMKHVGGNLMSRFTDFLASDGEKPSRRRDDEFVDDFPPGEDGREAAFEVWRSGWSALETALRQLSDADLDRTVRIRGVPHSVAQALARALSHMSYHQGQITLVARMLVGPSHWRTISIPRNGTASYLRSLGFDQPSANGPTAEERPILFLLEPDFPDAAAGEGPWYCPHCATVEGLLTMYPQLRARLDIRRARFEKPREGIVAMLGAELQSCPMLILPKGSPAPDAEHRVVNGRICLVGATSIGQYFSAWAGIGKPH